MYRLIAWCFVLCIILCFAANAFADTHTAASCENTTGKFDVQTAVTAADTGDTVSIPAGTCIWDTKLTVAKNITLSGAGSGVGGTIITGAIDTLIDYTGATASATQTLEITGMSLTTTSHSGDFNLLS